MRLEANVLVRRSPEVVAGFLADVRNIPQWDRGVADVRIPANTMPGLGFTFETFGEPGSTVDDGRMAYEVSSIAPTGTIVRLTSTAGNARYFKDAAWHFRLAPEGGGTRISCAAQFTLRLRYLFLAPILALMRRAITKDLEQLRRVLEAQ